MFLVPIPPWVLVSRSSKRLTLADCLPVPGVWEVSSLWDRTSVCHSRRLNNWSEGPATGWLIITLALSATPRVKPSRLSGAFRLALAGSYQLSRSLSESVTVSSPGVSSPLNPVGPILCPSAAILPLDRVDCRDDARDDRLLLTTDLNSTNSCWVRATD